MSWSHPEWLQNALELLKRAAGVEAITGRYVDTFRKQLVAFGQSDLMLELDPKCKAQLEACIAFNDSLAKRKRMRQSLRTLIEDGRWREAPSLTPPHPETAGSSPRWHHDDAQKLAFQRRLDEEYTYLDRNGIERDSEALWRRKAVMAAKGFTTIEEFEAWQARCQDRWEADRAKHRSATLALVNKLRVEQP